MSVVAALLVAFAWHVHDAPSEPQPLRFGIVADAQYADKPTAGSRRYREAHAKLRQALQALDGLRPAFVLQLGDIIDGNGGRSRAELDSMLAVCRGARTPVRHVVGNHCLAVPRAELVRALRLRSSWYTFRVRGWRFVVLDGMDVSRDHSKSPENATEAARYLAAKPAPPTYNGALGPVQMAWLREQLADAKRAGERVVVACHHPAVAAPGDISHTLWNGDDVQRALVEAGCVVAFISGHDHRGGYIVRDGIHHLTAPAICDAPAGGNAYALVEVYGDRLEVHGFGTFPTRTLRLSGATQTGS